MTASVASIQAAILSPGRQVMEGGRSNEATVEPIRKMELGTDGKESS